MHNEKYHFVAYHSRKFLDTERRYDVHDRELLAIVDALQHWRAYCEGAVSLDIYTNHKNLRYFITTKMLNMRQVR